MSREYLKQVAEETVEISIERRYILNNDVIYLRNEGDVTFFSLEDIESIKNDEDEYLEKAFYESKGCKIKVLNADSFEAARFLDHPLVLNFANAHYPGGGFYNGARAQEEELCRRSDLYGSLCTKEASKMYQYNQTHYSPYDSDCMILSENICVFRDLDYSLLPEPYYVSVITCPAVNKKRAHIETNGLKEVMMNRIESILIVAVKRGYRNLVLGAWGCGAFGNDAKKIANYFKTIIENSFGEFFDEIILAINGERYNLDMFTNIFEGYLDHQLLQVNGETKDNTPDYLTSKYPIISCSVNNYENGTLEGYCFGITSDGINFNIEKWSNGNKEYLSIVLPDIDELLEKKFSDLLLPDKYETFLDMDYSSLVDNEVNEINTDEEFEMLYKYISYLVSINIINYSTNVQNGSLLRFEDKNGNSAVKLIIMLKDKDEIFYTTPLKFSKPLKVTKYLCN